MHRHRDLCDGRVDPLEIAAGLEAHGVTDRTAARFRHRDVFSLAEELYARVPRADGAARRRRPPAAPSRRRPATARRTALRTCCPGPSRRGRGSLALLRPAGRPAAGAHRLRGRA